MLRERLLFSYRVLEYMARYRKEDILILKRAKAQEKRSGDGENAESGTAL